MAYTRQARKGKAGNSAKAANGSSRFSPYGRSSVKQSAMTKTTTKTKAATTTASKLSTLFGTTPKPSKTKVEKRRDPVQKEKDEELRDTLDAELPSVLAALAAPRVEEKAVDRQAKLERHKEELEQRQRQYEAVQNDMEDALKMLDSL